LYIYAEPKHCLNVLYVYVYINAYRSWRSNRVKSRGLVISFPKTNLHGQQYIRFDEAIFSPLSVYFRLLGLLVRLLNFAHIINAHWPEGRQIC